MGHVVWSTVDIFIETVHIDNFIRTAPHFIHELLQKETAEGQSTIHGSKVDNHFKRAEILQRQRVLLPKR